MFGIGSCMCLIACAYYVEQRATSMLRLKVGAAEGLQRDSPKMSACAELAAAADTIDDASHTL